jgi:hypothetical protein
MLTALVITATVVIVLNTEIRVADFDIPYLGRFLINLSGAARGECSSANMTECSSANMTEWYAVATFLCRGWPLSYR